MDRKHFSKRREENLWRIVDEAITDLRISVLKGLLLGFHVQAQEERIFKALNSLPDKIAAEYRKSLAK